MNDFRGKSSNRRGLVVSIVVCFAAFAIGFAITAFALRRAFHAVDNVAPSDRARLLAEGISEAMNWVAGGLVISAIAFVAGIVFAVRLYREKRDSVAPVA